MSNHLISEVYKRQVGSMARKAVLALFADKASDDGTGIWASKQRMAEEIGTTKQTVISTIKSLMDDDLVSETGKRRCANGFTVEYAINIKALHQIPLVASHQSNSLTGQAPLPVKPRYPTGKAALPKPSLNPPCSTEPKGSSEHKRVRAKPDAFPCPDGVDPVDWQSLVESRKAQRAPMNAGAYRQIIKKLDAWAGEGWPPGPIVAHAVERGWRTVFETDEMKGSANGRGRIQRNGFAAAHDSRDGVARALDRRLGLDGPAGAPGRHNAGTGESHRQLPAPTRDPLF